jgi:hypothetical protein
VKRIHEDMTLLSAHDVAAVLRDRLPGLPTKKLHKLLYYCQGHHLATFDAPLFRETILAWGMGPVVASLWRQEKAGAAPAKLAGLDEVQLVQFRIGKAAAISPVDSPQAARRVRATCAVCGSLGTAAAPPHLAAAGLGRVRGAGAAIVAGRAMDRTLPGMVRP